MRGYPLIGVLPGLVKDPLRFLLRAAQKHQGDVVELNLGVLRMLLLTQPAHARHILNNNWRNYYKGGGVWGSIRELVGESLVTTDGDDWLWRRRLLKPLFSAKHLANLVEIMVHKADEDNERLVRAARRSTPLEINTEMMRITRRIILATLFSTDIDAREADALSESVLVTFQRLQKRMFLSFVPPRLIPGDRAFRSALAHIDRTVMGVIHRRRASDTKHNDLLSLLLPIGLTDQQLRDELVTFFLAGYETTASAMTWTMYLLDRHPDVEVKVRNELTRVVGSRLPTAADLQDLVVTKRVFQEAMRIYPPAWLIPRTAKEDDEVDGFQIPKGTNVIMSPYVMHHDPNYWPDPSVFNPDRFSPERIAERPRYAYIPFGGGPRQCIGTMFTFLEAQVILAILFRRLRFRAVPGQSITPRALGTIQPRRGLMMHLSEV